MITLWKAIQRKLQTKLRQLLISRFDKVLSITRRDKKFSNQVAVEMTFFEGFHNRAWMSVTLQSQAILSSQIMEQADKIMNHRFNLLGSGEVELGPKIDWHCDFKSGYRWPRKYFPLLELDEFSTKDDLHKNKDIKVPWELSRLQHLVVLGQAYWLSGDEKYTREFMTETLSWIEENSPEIGVNWVCSMDVSLRIVSMIFAYFYFKSSPLVSKDFWDRYFTLLYYSGIHIEQNLEVYYPEHGNNHYLINCAALVWLGLFFSRYNRRTIRWLKKGITNLSRQMDYQVNPDGGSFEGSIAYHRLALETFLYTTILAEKNKIVFPETYKYRLEKMCEFSRDYLKSNGLAPQFGDADDGRFCVLSGYGTDDMRDHRSVLGIAGEYFQRDDFRKVADGKWLDSLWLFGQSGQQKEARISYPELVKYPDTGYYIMRENDVFLMIKCGSIGQKNHGGHDHNDQLSFELSIDGVDLMVDPGSYVYTRDKALRHLFRSTKYHNVSQLSSMEINEIRNENVKDLFNMYSCNPGYCTFFDQVSTGSLRFAGEIGLENPEIHYMRSVELNASGKFIEIIDAFSGTQEEGTCRLHLAKDVQVRQLTEKKIEIRSGNVKATIQAESTIRIEAGMVSPSYGVKFDSIILSWNFRHRTKFQICYE